MEDSIENIDTTGINIFYGVFHGGFFHAVVSIFSMESSMEDFSMDVYCRKGNDLDNSDNTNTCEPLNLLKETEHVAAGNHELNESSDDQNDDEEEKDENENSESQVSAANIEKSDDDFEARAISE
eukprot:Awhi_evm1s170